MSNLAVAEAIFRRIQTIDWAHHERVKDLEATAGDRITVEELATFSGASKSSDELMGATALLMHVKSVAETDVTIVKSAHKAPEARELRRKRKKNQKGGE